MIESSCLARDSVEGVLESIGRSSTFFIRYMQESSIFAIMFADVMIAMYEKFSTFSIPRIANTSTK